VHTGAHADFSGGFRPRLTIQRALERDSGSHRILAVK
jgi:hypothetical protein